MDWSGTGRGLRRAREWLNEDSLRTLIDLFLMLLSILLGVWLGRWMDHAAIDWPLTFTVLKDVATTIAVLIGGIWSVYILHRRRAHAVKGEIRHSYNLWRHSGHRMLRVGVSLRNCGEVIINPGVSYTEIQLPPDPLPDAQAQADLSWCQYVRIDHPWALDQAVIEPGETETYFHDVALPDCVGFLQVASVVKCENRDGDRLHWDETTLIDLERLAKGT